jgi:hypothetical protein
MSYKPTTGLTTGIESKYTIVANNLVNISNIFDDSATTYDYISDGKYMDFYIKNKFNLWIDAAGRSDGRNKLFLNNKDKSTSTLVALNVSWICVKNVDPGNYRLCFYDYMTNTMPIYSIFFESLLVNNQLLFKDNCYYNIDPLNYDTLSKNYNKLIVPAGQTIQDIYNNSKIPNLTNVFTPTTINGETFKPIDKFSNIKIRKSKKIITA